MISPTEIKQGLLQRLKQCYSIESAGGPNLIKVNCHAILYVRSGKNLSTKGTSEGRFWFGITATEYERSEKGNLFIVCCCQVNDYLVEYVSLPAEEFEKIKVLIPMQSGQYKFTLKRNDNGYYQMIAAGIEPCDVTDFVNCLDFTPMQFRQPERHHIDIVPKIGSPVTMPEKQDKLDTLPQRLRDAATDSQNPDQFEIVLETALSVLGFTCRRIGGPGETDILITEPVRIVVDAKSTAQRSKNAINFTRIKRHMSENRASRMVVVSVNFDPAVVRDAVMEGTALIPIETFALLINKHLNYVFAPDRIVEIMFRPGLANLTRLNELVDQDDSAQELQIIDLLLRVLDYEPVSTDVVRGRMDTLISSRGIPKIETEQLSKVLDTLSTSLIGVAERVGNLYRRRYPPDLAIKRLSMINARINEIQAEQSNRA